MEAKKYKKAMRLGQIGSYGLFLFQTGSMSLSKNISMAKSRKQKILTIFA